MPPACGAQGNVSGVATPIYWILFRASHLAVACQAWQVGIWETKEQSNISTGRGNDLRESMLNEQSIFSWAGLQLPSEVAYIKNNRLKEGIAHDYMVSFTGSAVASAGFLALPPTAGPWEVFRECSRPVPPQKGGLQRSRNIIKLVCRKEHLILFL